MKVAIYDSGVGGLTILEALAERMPDSNYIFVSDNAAYPYGTKDEAELLSRCDISSLDRQPRYSMLASDRLSILASLLKMQSRIGRPSHLQ